MNTSSRNIFTIFIFLCLSIGLSAQSVKDALFLIQEDGRFGYINGCGEEIIPPMYKEAGPFVQGLAPVFINGYVGFIDAQNNMVIPPVYDYAEPFSEGCALVHQDGKPIFINLDGTPAFDLYQIFSNLIEPSKDSLPNLYQPIQCSSFKDGYATIQRNVRAIALLNESGQLWGGKAFSVIHLPFLHNRVLVEDNKQMAIFDKEGKVIVPFGQYKQVEIVKNGMIKFRDSDENWKNQIVGFLDNSGREIAMIPTGDSLSFYNKFPSDGMIAGTIYRKINVQIKNGRESYQTESFPMYYDLKRKKIIRNELATWMITPFHNNHTFVRTKDGHKIMNKNGQLIGPHSYEEVILYQGFYQGAALVKYHRAWRLINTKGEFVSEESWTHANESGFNNGIAFVGTHHGNFGTINTKGEWVSPPVEHGNIESLQKMGDWYGKIQRQGINMVNLKTGEHWSKYCHFADPEGFKNGLILTIKNQRISYLDKTGHVVWQQAERPTTSSNLDTLNISYQRCAGIRGFSSNKTDITCTSTDPKFVRKTAEKVTRSLKFPKNQLSVTLKKSTKKDTIRGNYATQRYYIANLTQDTFKFNTQDNRLYARLQALNKAGEWKDIESLPGSWCGNSYYPAHLNPNEYWTGLIPMYKGGFKTQLRLAVFGFNRLKPPYAKENPIYSTPFEGSINPAQFWRQESWIPLGMMNAAYDYKSRDF